MRLRSPLRVVACVRRGGWSRVSETAITFGGGRVRSAGDVESCQCTAWCGTVRGTDGYASKTEGTECN